MTVSGSIPELSLALERLHNLLRPVKRNMENPSFRSKYADLAAVMQHCRRPLRQCRLVVMQTASSGIVDGAWQADITTRLVHTPTQQWVQSNLSVPCFDAQSLAKGITYGRRIAYQTIVGLVVESEDDDGNAANGQREEGKPAGAMDTTRIRVLEVLKVTKRRFRPYYRFRGSDANIYGTADQKLAEQFGAMYAAGDDYDVTYKQIYETREVQAIELVPPAEQSQESPL